MTDPSHSIHLELHFDGAALTGHVRDEDGGDPRAFSGWVGLVRAIEDLIHEPVKSP
ncbi:hypothetical protein OJ997_08645 [Solirubrobacter phytolaccae]|uniref:Uncharacterized protein n=1 Tax=Solirubrobacter phytolaccae TaxID=1404360 RepID=A0A9X3SEF7_9ACTN|nr:hypothetical protein [Solirubrobacter phytolaccae]MDA0180362.1 hypothetical protein [Solirubrobacter phytolaccae]